MTNSNNFAEKTVVAFHIGRGGRFNNQGHLSFIGEERIGKFTDDLFLTWENAWEIGRKIGERENLQKLFELALDDDDDARERLQRIGLDLGDKVYADASGHLVGLAEWQMAAGVGRIERDRDYDTTYTRYLSDCNEKELQLIVDYNYYVSQDIVDYAKEQLGIVDEEETEE